MKSVQPWLQRLIYRLHSEREKIEWAEKMRLKAYALWRIIIEVDSCVS
jgi:hypothetical protein